MKNITYLLFIFALSITELYAKPVIITLAKEVAVNFYNKNSNIKVKDITLAYTSSSKIGAPLYFAFNINNNDGFVIVSGDDAIKPIIGYSTENNFVRPKANTTIAYWLNDFSNAIETKRSKSFIADDAIVKEWARYLAITNQDRTYNIVSSVTDTVAPLVQTTWDQSPNYNSLCPGGSVTGCVATAMAQIMKFWNYPSQGADSSSYCDCVASGYQNDYSTLSANYSATTYNWANMPLAYSNSDVALLMYHCGVSVDMDYSPSESNAYVLTADKPVCSQSAYINYFKYNPYTLQGIKRANYTDTQWIQVLKNELLNGRPIQYLAQDPANGGHSWVVDGFDINNNFNMNWGWGGYDNGYYNLDNLDPSSDNFSSYHEALIGIVPMSITANAAGIISISEPITGCNDTIINPVIKLQNYGSSTLSSSIINYQIDNGTIQTYTWNGSLTSGQTANVNLPSLIISSAGNHTFVCSSISANNTTNANFANSQSSINFYIVFGTNTPLAESFETTTSLPNSIWNISHTSTGVDFTITSNAAATGTKSVMIDNINNIAGNNSLLQTSSSYDMTTFTTPSLTFKAAYQQKTITNADKLQIYTSTDCGTSWVSRRAITSTTLASLAGGTGTSPYTPTPSKFTTYTVNINGVANNHNVMFRWEFYADPNGPGNNLYIDDINIISSVTGIQNIEELVNLNIYPNPSSGKVNIDFNLSEKHNIAIQVSDILGRVVENFDTKSYEAGETVLVFGSANLYQTGVYLINLNIDGQHIVKKIIIQ
jgi:hypothetical protein